VIERPKLLWFGRPSRDEDKREATNRNLIIEEVLPKSSPDFTHARAAIFWATMPHFELAVSELERLLVAAVNNGLYAYVVVETLGQLNEVNRVLNERHPHGARDGTYRVRTSAAISPLQPHEAPQEALLHYPGPRANRSLLIETPPDVSLSEAHRLLLQRAFHDCKAIKLELIIGGFSGALTFDVRATLAASNAGPTPMPFFAKLHESAKLREEMQSFREYAEHHVAWYLRPNFLPDRCLYGVQHGILVGSFVEDSRSLWEVAVEGNGPRHIRSLFKETLGVLRQDPQVADPGTHGSVVEPLEDFCKHWRVPKDRVERAKQFGGEVHSPPTLWRKLLNLPSRKWLRTSIHGDMHANNVRIRKEDSIVIDFAHAAKGPMCTDLASLEVWLTFEWPRTQHFDNTAWQQRTEHVYRPAEIMRTSFSESDTATQHWLLPCLQEIRQLAMDATLHPDEYLRVLSVYLLRHATFPANARCDEDDEFRRTYAYWLANRLVLSLCQMPHLELEEVA
jgi:Phosphotransferase enzyme family